MFSNKFDSDRDRGIFLGKGIICLLLELEKPDKIFYAVFQSISSTWKDQLHGLLNIREMFHKW